jgi:hypothetical protein
MKCYAIRLTEGEPLRRSKIAVKFLQFSMPWTGLSLANLKGFGKFVNRLTERRSIDGSVILRQHPNKEDCSSSKVGARASGCLSDWLWTRLRLGT